MLFNQNAYSQFGSNTQSQPSQSPSPEDGFSGARPLQARYAQPMQPIAAPQPAGSPSGGAQPPRPASRPIPQAPPSPTPVPSMPTSGMTWSQMQSQGYARPPFPGTPNPSIPPGVQYPMVGGSGVNPSIPPGVEYPLGPSGAAPGVTGPQTLEQQLQQRYQQSLGTPTSGIGGQLASGVSSLLSNPSPYLTDAYQSQLDKTMGQIDDQYNAADQSLHQNLASRGLDTAGTIGSGDQRYNNLLRRSAKTDAATNQLNQLAQTYSGDRTNAINAAMGYEGQQQGEQQSALQNLLGYGQQSFQNQLQTSAFNQNQDQMNTQILLQLLGAGY